MTSPSSSIEPSIQPLRPKFDPTGSHSNSPEAQAMIKSLGLEEHPEGGYFVQTDRDDCRVPNPFLIHANGSPKPAASPPTWSIHLSILPPSSHTVYSTQHVRPQLYLLPTPFRPLQPPRYKPNIAHPHLLHSQQNAKSLSRTFLDWYNSIRTERVCVRARGDALSGCIASTHVRLIYSFALRPWIEHANQMERAMGTYIQ